MNKHVIYPIPLWTGPSNKSIFMYRLGEFRERGDASFNNCAYIWYIKGPKENIIVESGSTVEQMAAVGYEKKKIQSVEDGLAKHGLKPSDIDIVIQTHMHHDHIAEAYKYTNAKFIVQKKELEFARNPHPVFAGVYYEREFFDGLNFQTVEGDADIVEGISVLFTPGHSAGTQSVAIETAKGTAIICGCCVLKENFSPPEGIRERLPVFPPGQHTDVMAAYESVLRVKGLAKIIINMHDCEFLNTQKIP